MIVQQIKEIMEGCCIALSIGGYKEKNSKDMKRMYSNHSLFVQIWTVCKCANGKIYIWELMACNPSYQLTKTEFLT